MTYAVSTPVAEDIAPVCAIYAATAPVIEFVASAPVVEYVDYAPLTVTSTVCSQNTTRFIRTWASLRYDAPLSQRRMLIGRFRREDEIAGLSEAPSLLSGG